jgi:hypothetical protein
MEPSIEFTGNSTIRAQLTRSAHERLIEALIAWDKLERENHSNAILDFNLLDGSDIAEKSYRNRLEVLQDLELMASSITDDKVEKRVTAHITYLRALMGQQFDFETYIRKTQRLPLVFYEDDYIHLHAEKTRKTIEALNGPFDSSVFDHLNKLESTLPSGDVEDYFQESFRRHKSFLWQQVQSEVDFPVKIETVDVDAYWWCWVDTWQQQFRLRINTKHGNYTPTKALLMVYHELLAHCCQMAIWKEQIAQGKMDRIWGLTTVHSPEQFLFEGIAQTLPLFIPIEQTQNPILQARLRLSHFGSLINNNLHVMINEGKSVEECLDYARQLAPWMKPEDIAEDLASRSNNILFRSYQYVYPGSFDFFLTLADTLSTERKKEFLATCYHEVLYYEDLEGYR